MFGEGEFGLGVYRMRQLDQVTAASVDDVFDA